MIPHARIQDELDKLYLGQLKTICLVVIGYYSFLTAMHFVFLPSELLAPVAGTSILAALSGLILHQLVHRNLVPAKQSHLAFTPVAALALLTIFVHIWVSQEQHQLTNAVLIQYALSLITLSPIVFGMFTALCAGSFVAALIVLPGPYTAHFGFMLFGTLVLSILGFVLRYRALYKSVRLLAGSRDKARSLATKSQEIKVKMLEVQKANAARDTFLANVTHELRTPLTGVMGMLDLMDDTGLNKEQTFMVSTARKSADFLLNIVNDLLDFAKLDAGKVTLKPSIIDVEAITSDVVGTFEGAARTKGLTIEYEILHPAPKNLIGDGARIAQMLLNLLNNAVKFTQDGGIRVTLQHKDGTTVWSVADTGCGIPSDQVSRLFNRFEQIDDSSTRKSAGTGLGLAITKELTDLFDGTIDVESTEGEGATFTLSLPLDRPLQPKRALDKMPADLEAGKKDTASANSSAPSFAKYNLRALVAEDNDVNQILIKKILEKLGIDFTIVENGVQAVSAAKGAKTPYDIIFMDVQMPVMDGVTATREIRSSLHTPPPIVAITANTLDTDLLTYEQAGMVDFVGKPINMDKLYKCISDLVVPK